MQVEVMKQHLQVLHAEYDALYERICRGEDCPCCGAPWVPDAPNPRTGSSMEHLSRCSIPMLRNLICQLDVNIYEAEEIAPNMVGFLMGCLYGTNVPLVWCSEGTPTHGWQKVTEGFSGTGFAGGQIHHYGFSCGCRYDDESDDYRAAR